MSEDLCTQCGKCCYFPTGKGGILQACPHLERKEDKFHCNVYDDRLNRLVGSNNGKEYYCGYYNAMDSEIEGCPLNYNEGKPKRDVIIPKDDFKLAQGIILK